jgi:hypothetical protein
MTEKTEIWLGLYAQKKEFTAINSKLFKILYNFKNRPFNHIIEDCLLALEYGEDRIFTLNVLLYLNEDIKERLLSNIVDIAISGSQAEIGLAYQVLYTMQVDFVRKHTYSFILYNIENYVDKDEIEDNFLQIINLLRSFQMQNEIHHFLTNYCLNADDNAIKKLYSMYW